MKDCFCDGSFYIGGRVCLRPVRGDYADGVFVSQLRNHYRQWYFNPQVVTPSSHMAWCAQKSPYDEVWIVEQTVSSRPIGVTSLTIDPQARTAEYGRTMVHPQFLGQGYATEIEWTAMYLGFEFFRLTMLSGELLPANPIAKIHDLTGWQREGLNVPGHTRPGVDTLYITIDRAQWGALSRPDFVRWLYEKQGIILQLGELD